MAISDAQWEMTDHYCLSVIISEAGDGLWLDLQVKSVTIGQLWWLMVTST